MTSRSDFTELLRGLWPRWKPTPAEIELYRERLQGLKPERVSHAIRELRSTSRAAAPVLSTILRLAEDKAPPKPAKPAKPEREPDPTPEEVEALRQKYLDTINGAEAGLVDLAREDAGRIGATPNGPAETWSMLTLAFVAQAIVDPRIVAKWSSQRPPSPHPTPDGGSGNALNLAAERQRVRALPESPPLCQGGADRIVLIEAIRDALDELLGPEASAARLAHAREACGGDDALAWRMIRVGLRNLAAEEDARRRAPLEARYGELGLRPSRSPRTAAPLGCAGSPQVEPTVLAAVGYEGCSDGYPS